MLFIYDKGASPTVLATFATRGSKAHRDQLDGSYPKHPDFDGQTLRNVALPPGNVTVFRIEPLADC